MKSIVGQSSFHRASRRLVLVGVMAGLSGCSPPDVRVIHFQTGSGTGIAIGREGDVIIAAADGTVDYIASSANSELVIIYHGRDDDGLHMRTTYAYHRELFVKQGEPITRGQVIGIVGGKKRQYLQFSVAKAPQNLYGISSAWIYENLHDYWVDGPGNTTCFQPEERYPETSSKKLTWPLECQSVERFGAADSKIEHPKLNSARHQRMFRVYLDYFDGLHGFKVLVMSDGGGWSYRSRITYEKALGDAMTSCAENMSLAGCRLFAVGNTIVWDMTPGERERVIAEYRATRESTSIDTTAPMSSSAFAGFQNYELMVDDFRFKVFVMSESGNWQSMIRLTYEEALEDAMDVCDQRTRHSSPCRLFAAGNTVVWDMSEEERGAVIETYSAKNNN